MKWIAPTVVYLEVALGLCWFHSAWGALLGFHLVIIISLLIAKPNIAVADLCKSTDAKCIILSIMLCGSSGVSLYFLWSYLGVANDVFELIESLGLSPDLWLFFIAYFALVNPFIEEYFWRGYLGHKTKGLHASDFLYAGFHTLILFGKVSLYFIISALFLLMLAGWFWRQIAREDQGLLASVLGHMAADFTILVAVYLRM
jgi:membrane protease YdiL (CAAX protease family)